MKSSFLMKYKNKECSHYLMAGMIVGLVIFTAVESIAGVQLANVDLKYGGNGLIETRDYYCRGDEEEFLIKPA